MVTERSQRLSEQLRRRPEIPIALVVLAALLIGVLWRSRDDRSADAAIRVDSAPASATTAVVPTFTYVVNPLLTTTTTTTLPPVTTIYQPSLTTFPIGGTYPTTVYQPTTTRYVPVTTYPRPTVTVARPTTTLPIITTLPTLPTTTVATTTSTTTSTTSTTTTTVPAGRPTVLVIGTDATPADTDRRVKLISKLYQSGYNPIGVVNTAVVGNASAGYSTTGPGGATVALTDALVAAEPDAKWDKITWGTSPTTPPWSEWQTAYQFTLAVTLVGPYPPK